VRGPGLLLVAACCLALPGCDQRREREAEVAEAVRSAYLLERRVLDDRARLGSREEVAQIYREGFGEEMADRLAAVSWSEEAGEVHAGGFALEPPDRVVARRISDDVATVVFETPVVQRFFWLERPYTVAELQRQSGRWRIVRALTVTQRPPELGPIE
jgi:hypothetical protein